mmetsp:Transcript_4193/g.12123  ORF Transcript_4193/g.12123 Transcript_4193/m.12123 type:complete len:106 (+) Transcript_4193:88-405(+)
MKPGQRTGGQRWSSQQSQHALPTAGTHLHPDSLAPTPPSLAPARLPPHSPAAMQCARKVHLINGGLMEKVPAVPQLPAVLPQHLVYPPLHLQERGEVRHAQWWQP